MEFKTRIYLEGLEGDLVEDVEFASTYAVNDVRNISVTRSDYSKTISLPGTHKNNKLFNYLFDIKSTGDQASYDASSPNIGYNYDFKRKIKATITQDNQVVLDGYAKLLDVITEKGLVKYNIQVTSELGAFIASLSDYKLENLDGVYALNNDSAEELVWGVPQMTSQFTHTMGLVAINQSWNTAVSSPGSSYFYPLIDYGQFDTVNGSNWYVDNLRPCLFLRTYLDMIFAAAGYTYSSGFMDSDYFQNLFLPYKEGTMTRRTQPTVLEISGSTLNYLTSPSTVRVDVFNKEISDPNNAWVGTDYIFPGPGSYQLDADFNYNMIISYRGAGPIPLGKATNAGNITFTLSANFFDNFGTLIDTLVIGSNTIPRGGIEPFTVNSSTTTLPPYTGFNLKNTVTFYKPSSAYKMRFQLQADSEKTPIEMFTYVKSNGDMFSSVSGTTTIQTFPSVNSSPRLSISQASVFNGSTLYYQDFCLKDVKCVDLFSSVVKLFNLYVVRDNDKPKHFNIYTRDEFFSNVNKVDWTKKLDLSSSNKITPIPNLDSNQLTFSYKADNDYYNKRYTSLYGGIYGSTTIGSDYEFNNSTKNVVDGIIFSPTPIVQYANISYPSENSIEILASGSPTGDVNRYNIYSTDSYKLPQTGTDPIPTDMNLAKARTNNQISYFGSVYNIVQVQGPNKIFVTGPLTRTPGSANVTIPKAEISAQQAVDLNFYATADTFQYISNNDKMFPCIYDSSDENVTRKPIKVNPRILSFGGMKPCNTYYVTDTPVLQGKTYSGVNNIMTRTQYPFSHHWNTYTNPTVDLLFDSPKGLFFTNNGQYPAGNLYQLYWRNTVNEILDNEAKMFSAEFHLTPNDISRLDLSKTVHIDGTDYRLNQILDYKADPSALTEVELIRKPIQIIQPNPIYSPEPRGQQARIKIDMSAVPLATGKINGVVVQEPNFTSSNVYIFGGSPVEYPEIKYANKDAGVWYMYVQYSQVSLSNFLRVTDSLGNVTNVNLPSTGDAQVSFSAINFTPDQPVVIQMLPKSSTTTSSTTTTTTTLCNSLISWGFQEAMGIDGTMLIYKNGTLVASGTTNSSGTINSVAGDVIRTEVISTGTNIRSLIASGPSGEFVSNEATDIDYSFTIAAGCGLYYIATAVGAPATTTTVCPATINYTLNEFGADGALHFYINGVFSFAVDFPGSGSFTTAPGNGVIAYALSTGLDTRTLTVSGPGVSFSGSDYNTVGYAWTAATCSTYTVVATASPSTSTSTTTTTTTTAPPATNFTVRNNATSGSITNVTPSVYVSSYTFPLNPSDVLFGTHGGFSSALGVAVTGISTPKFLILLKNSVIQHSLSVTANGTYTFSAVTFTGSDQVEIIMTDQPTTTTTTSTTTTTTTNKNSDAFIVQNSRPGAVINNVTPSVYITGDSFPLNVGDVLTGVHGTFTASIVVNITGAAGSTLELFRGGGLTPIQTLTSVSGNNTFSSFTFTNLQECKIVLR